ncbi:methionyl-tRNA formyltransferase [Deltaproteobacteria bacterium]|nr:methionyl-tRNA formyltransferase [Deltaproteobacteria bacterium]
MTAITNGPFPEKPDIIFMGTPEFAVPVLKGLINEGHRILAVVTQPDRPKGRGRKTAVSPVKKLALEHDIETLQPQKVSDSNFCDLIKKKAPDLIIVVAFGQILTDEILMIPEWGAINIHASLLPRHRGAAPIQHSILNNETLTGLTVIRMDEGLDTGPILYQEEIPIKQDETSGQLRDKLSGRSGDLIIRFLRLMAGNQISEVPQEDSFATYAPKITKNMSIIEWDMDAIRISSLIRALDPSPGACTGLGGKKLKLFSSRVLNERGSDSVPGRVVRANRAGLHVESGKGVIEIGEVQYPGKKRLPSKDFLMGFSLPEGTILGD